MFLKKIKLLSGIVITSMMLAFSLPVLESHAEGDQTEGGNEYVYEEDTTGTSYAPSSLQVALYENYNADYQLYEESIGDMFYFYTNVGNGTFSSDPVYFEFPENVDYSLEKNGSAVPYDSSNKVTELGNYVMRVSGSYEGTTYFATFRFSIREMPSVTTPEPTEISDEDDYSIDENDTIDDEVIQEIIEEQGAEMDDEYGLVSLVGAVAQNTTGLAQAYNMLTGSYLYRLLDGSTFTASVPNGAIVNDSVTIELPGDMTPTVYKDGEEYEFSGLYFEEPGFYQVCLYESSLAFSMVYPEEKNYPFITFRIVKDPIRDLSVFNAPQGMHIVSVVKDEIIEFDGAANQNANFNTLTNLGPEDEYNPLPEFLNYYWMDEDGVYGFVLTDDSESVRYSVNITKDTKKPEFEAGIKNGVATFTYTSTDIARFELVQDGMPVEEFNANSISGKGNYELSIYDKAGNVTKVTFTLGNSVNSASITSIVILILLIGFCFYVVQTSKSGFRVR